jgi:hypothetical protein
MLLEDGRVDPTDYNNCALLGAIICDRTEVVRILLADRRVVDAGLDAALHHVEIYNQPEMYRLLMEAMKRDV